MKIKAIILCGLFIFPQFSSAQVNERIQNYANMANCNHLSAGCHSVGEGYGCTTSAEGKIIQLVRSSGKNIP